MMPLAWLPNVAGFTFVGVLHTGDRVRCSVTVGPDFLHRVKEYPLSALRGWFRS